MYKKKIKILIYKGFHIRLIIKLIELSNNFSSNIFFIKGKTVNLKDIFNILKLNIKYNDSLIIKAYGLDEQKAVEKIIKLINYFCIFKFIK